MPGSEGALAQQARYAADRRLQQAHSREYEAILADERTKRGLTARPGTSNGQTRILRARIAELEAKLEAKGAR